MVRAAQRRRPVADAGRLDALGVPRNATTHGSLWVIQWCTTSPSSPAISAAYSAKRSAVSRAAQPPRRLARLRQVPVVERRDRLDAALEQPLDEPPVEVDAARGSAPRGRRAARAARRSRSGRTRRPATPSGRGRRASGGSGRRRRRRCRRRRPRPGGGRSVPDRRAAAVLVDRALDLVGGHRDAEAEVRGTPAAGSAGPSGVIPSPRPRSGPSPASAG